MEFTTTNGATPGFVTPENDCGPAAPHNKPAKTLSKRTSDFIADHALSLGSCMPLALVILQALLGVVQ